MPRLANDRDIYLELEAVLDKHRRAGVPEAIIAGVIQRAWHCSQQIEQSRAWQSTPTRR